jgi:hypothetical protein
MKLRASRYWNQAALTRSHLEYSRRSGQQSNIKGGVILSLVCGLFAHQAQDLPRWVKWN